VVIRKISALNNNYKETLDSYSVLNEKKDDVITDFSHKIRESLNNLVIISDIFMESGLNTKQKELLESFIASTNNMVATLNELTMKSAGNLNYESRKHIRFNLLSTVNNTIDLFNLNEKARIDIRLNEYQFSDLECFGDPIIVKQILLDLFNTIEGQSTDRPVKVTINLSKIQESATEKLIGFTIQTDYNKKLIDEKAIERSLAARYIATSKGTFTQELGDNTAVIKISMPFINPVEDLKQATASSKIEELIQKQKVHKEMKDLKILLAEDNVINQKITLLTLKPLVQSIDSASNGKEALDKFGTTNYDLILMDIQMPVMNGLLASEKIRALESTTNSHIPIIAITANAMLDDKEKCLAVGIDDYISKPFQPAVLIEKIKNLI
jgi:CheY-like chemotaxis protein